jgi:hypothetical protein
VTPSRFSEQWEPALRRAKRHTPTENCHTYEAEIE